VIAGSKGAASTMSGQNSKKRSVHNLETIMKHGFIVFESRFRPGRLCLAPCFFMVKEPKKHFF
jgi:hypothetical protein